tara:strand:- start:143 stop:499 length:357 start_codon:yes stop_codon:yes gene_type:complete
MPNDLSIFQQRYQNSKDLFINYINNNVNTIILYGGGGNGKSHLTNELTNELNNNSYNVFSPNDTYNWNNEDFINNINNPEKKIIHFLFNPLTYWNITNTSSVELIDMSNINVRDMYTQ